MNQSLEISETADATEKSPAKHCTNCDAALVGRYCHACGQTAHVHRSIGHMLEEFLHGILHFDSKAWRTLPALILHPGKLTRDYIFGKRTRYVSPLFLFLFLNLVMFIALSYLGKNLGPETSYKAMLQSGMTNEINNTQTEIDSLTAKLQILPANDPSLATLSDRIEQLKLKRAGIQRSLAASRAEIDTQAQTNKAQSATQQASSEPIAWFERTIDHALENPDLVFYKMKGTASKFAFILIPISLPFLWLLFCRRRDILVFDHCIFSLYSLSFMCLLIILVAGFARLGLATMAWGLILIAPPAHMFAQLRGTYQLSIGATIWRTLALLLIAGFALCVYFVAITWLSL